MFTVTKSMMKRLVAWRLWPPGHMKPAYVTWSPPPTTAMHSYNNAYMVRLMRLLKMSGINFVANPCVNVHLGGRVDTYPKRRAMTRVKELTAEGCNVSFGNDDIFDPIIQNSPSD